MTLEHGGRIAVVAGVLGAATAVWLLLPLPPVTDLYAARRWGVGAGYIGFLLGFPLSIAGVPLSVALHPYPVGSDTAGAGTMVALLSGVVGVNWAAWAAFCAALIRKIRHRRTSRQARTSRRPT